MTEIQNKIIKLAGKRSMASRLAHAKNDKEVNAVVIYLRPAKIAEFYGVSPVLSSHTCPE